MTPLNQVANPKSLDEGLIREAADLHISDLTELGIRCAQQGFRRAAFRIVFYLNFCHRHDDANRVRIAVKEGIRLPERKTPMKS